MALEEEVTLSATSGNICTTVTIMDDDVVEENEFFQIIFSQIKHVSGYYGPYQLLNPITTVAIIDDDGKHISK